MSLFTSSDVAEFRSERLFSVLQTYAPGWAPSDSFLLGKLRAAEAHIARELAVLLEPTQIFPYEPTEAEITALGSMPYLQEPGYDYDSEFFRGERWGFMILRQRPIISIDYVRFTYPTPMSGLFTIPDDWVRPDKKYGTINFVPSGSTWAAPLNAFVVQTISGGKTIPFMLQVKYVAGLTGVRTDPRWADLVDVIFKQAALSLVEDAYSPSSGSISSDGHSQSMSVDTSKYTDIIDRKLNGPKGSNGGLRASIHGMGGMIFGGG